uniref:Fas activated serine/threonine kinase n=1 Tax=Salvator merianae TaxID=96440 RepID=A0A8D0DG60_SALMN
MGVPLSLDVSLPSSSSCSPRLRFLWRLPGRARGLSGGSSFARSAQQRSGDASSLTLWRLLHRSRSAGELLRWLPQNEARAVGAHYALALRCLLRGVGTEVTAETLLRHPDFQAFSAAAARAAAHFDDVDVDRCLQAAAALGLPEQSLLLGALRQEVARRRVEEERGKEELLAALLSSSHFFERRQERFVRSLAGGLAPGGGGPSTMTLLAKYLARHRLRETRLLDCIAAFLLERIQQLDSKVIQKLVLPFSRMNYRPSNQAELFPQLEAELEKKAAASPLATVNILMSLFQLQFFPLAVLHQVFSPAFLSNVTGSPCGAIVCRYLSFLDSAVALEVPDYEGPRLAPQYCVSMFDGALTADEANSRYSYKGLVGEALRQLVGEGCYQQDEMLLPGYCALALPYVLHGLEDLTVPFRDRARVVLSVNDSWHYCHNTAVLVGSRAMCHRHLQLLGFRLVQLPYLELERLKGIEEVKRCLGQKLRALHL